MKTSKIVAMSGAAVLALAVSAHAMSAAAERDITRELNLQQQHGIDTSASVTDASTPNAPPAAAPTHRIQVADATMPVAAPLTSLNNPPPKMATANVADSHGEIIGAVQRVQISSSGAPLAGDGTSEVS